MVTSFAQPPWCFGLICWPRNLAHLKKTHAEFNFVPAMCLLGHSSPLKKHYHCHMVHRITPLMCNHGKNACRTARAPQHESMSTHFYLGKGSRASWALREKWLDQEQVYELKIHPSPKKPRWQLKILYHMSKRDPVIIKPKLLEWLYILWSWKQLALFNFKINNYYAFLLSGSCKHISHPL